MSQAADQPDKKLSPDDALPPVEPPSAGFIVQLFIIPAVIVLIIVMVYMLFSWIARSQTNAQDLLSLVERNNIHSWQAAHDLAIEISRSDELKQDEELAEQIANQLDTKMAAALPTQDKLPNNQRPRESAVALRVYLCKALGEFEVPTGLDTLLDVAQPKSNEYLQPVRRAAIDALSVLVWNTKQAGREISSERLEETLLEASRDEDYHIRLPGTVALGALGTPAAQERLAQMLYDERPEVGYNAALHLARHGDARSVPKLVEMLDPQEDIAVRNEEEEFRAFKRQTIFLNALRAARKLASSNDSADLTPLISAVQGLREADIEGLVPPGIDQQVKTAAEETLEVLEERRELVETPAEAVES